MYLILTQGRILEIPGGEVKATISLANWLHRKNHDVTIMGSGFASVKTKHLSINEIETNEKYKNEKNKQTKFKVLNPPYIIYMFSRLFLTLLWIKKIITINSKNRIKLIHAQDTGYSGLAAILSGKILHIPVVLASHGIRHKSLEHTLRGKFNKLILKLEYRLDIFTINNADCIIAINPTIKNYYKKLTKKRIEYIPNTINIKNFEFSQNSRENIRKEFRIEKKSKVIGYIGRLSPEKNLLTLLQAFYEVSKNLSIKLMLVGMGIDELKLKKFIHENNIGDKVIFCGFRHDIPQILSAVDIFVLPSFTEGLPTSMLEAMASSRAIICSNIPAHQNLVENNKEALFIDPHKPEELKESIQLLCSNDSLIEKLGNNAKNKVSNYDEKVVFPKILQLYRSILEEKNEGGK